MIQEDDKLKDECGVFGIYNATDAAALIALGLHALQHRGQESGGIFTVNGEGFHSHRDLGLIGDIFGEQSVMDKLTGKTGIGHVRYGTTGESTLRNVQPLFADLDMGGFALAHNGNLTNACSLRAELVKTGSIFHSTVDTEVILHLMAISQEKETKKRLLDALEWVKGAYSIVAMTKDALYGVRDPNGVRPLVLGELAGSYVLASESCALDIIGADYVRDIEPGEMVVITDQGLESIKTTVKVPHKFCIFEYVYFSRPDSYIEGKSVYDVRKKIGVELAKESAVEADLVVPVPDSGVPSAIGYAEAAGIPFDLGIIRNHYVGRTFIEPTDTIRHLGVKLKHNANKGILEGKRVILVDDSLVRGTTSKKIVEMVRKAGAKEIHMRIASPPVTHSCFYGIDTPDQKELLAHTHSVEEIKKIIGVDTLSFLSPDGLYRACGEEKGRDNTCSQFCDACFSGDYTIELTDKEGGTTGKQLSFLTEVEA
ncbi:MAG: amidophosphoribosyltransferase [Alphaproteobacteria bacterium]